MGTGEPKYRKKINQKQLALLHILYRFRFVTTDLVASYQGKKNGASVYPRLATLVEQGYIGRKYESQYRLRGQPAAYFLLGKGLRVLRDRPDVEYSTKILRNIHADKTASEQFISRNLAVMEAYCNLKKIYGDQLQFFTKSDLAVFDHFPEPPPDAYLRLNVDGEVRQYFLDVHQDTRPFFVATRRLNSYATYADSSKWKKTGEKLPDILALCETKTLQRRLQKRAARESHPDFNIFLTTKEALSRIAQDIDILQPAHSADELVALESASG